MRPCIPATSAPSATGRQSRELQKGLACPKARPNRSRHRFAAPPSARRATAPERIQAPFSLDRARPVSLLARPKGAPAAPRAVGRGGARERAQFSPQAETELSGLCDDDNGGRILRGSGPLWEQNPPRPPGGGDQPLRDAGPRRLGYSALRGASKIFVKNSALDGNFFPLPCVSTGKRSRCSPESIGKDERE